MNSEQVKQPCKKKFKGVENFLRRVAFNLGNTPSQTEVKIISCIPIDVTDLQQKIISLEKQLEQSTKTKVSPSKPTSAVHTALCCQGFPNYSNVAVSCKYSDVKLSKNKYENCPTKQRKSNVSFVCPATHQTQHTTVQPGIANSRNSITENGKCYSTEESPKCNSVERRRNIFRKDRKNKTPKKKDKTQLVYYAQTTTSPFKIYDKINLAPEKKRKNVTAIDQKYLANMIRKQYKPEIITNKSSDCSQFSSPVCRDVNQTCFHPCSYESDVCSCCHGRFQNIDDHIEKSESNNIPNATYYSRNECYDNNIYYDSSFYDIVPVKEKANNNDLGQCNREYKKIVDVMFWPENAHLKSQYRPLIVNHQNKLPVRNEYVRKISSKFSTRKGNKCKTTLKRKRILNEMEQNAKTENSKNCSIDCRDVYTKTLCTKTKPKIINEPTKTVIVKHAECLTNNFNDTECQNRATESIQTQSEENKAEITLNQIKSIFQSVLAEVKANAQTKIITAEKSKKDTVMQKEPSHYNMQTHSTLLSSFTYSPYNTNSYIPSCSRQMTSNYCYPTLPFPTTKYIQNYPLFIHTPARRTCTSCYRHNTRVTKPTQDKQAHTTVTKVEAENNRNNETEKLIKEIYKSMALNINTPSNDTSASNCDDVNYVANYSAVNKSVYKPKIVKTKSSIIMTNIGKIDNSTIHKKNKNDNKEMATNMTTTTVNTDTTFSSKLNITAGTICSQISNTRESDRLNYNLDNKTRKRMERKVERADRITEEASSSKRYSDDEYETDNSDTESENTLMPVSEPIEKIKQKKGLFSKMAKLFKSKNKRIEKSVETESEIGGESEASDSDDYQTVYSQKIDKTPRRYTTRAHRDLPSINAHKLRPHSKISYSRQQRSRIDERPRMSPYLEQEYRRYWNEKIMFHRDQGNRHSSKENFSWESIPRTRPGPVYWQNYEARSALVDNRGQQPRNNIIHKSVAPNYTTVDKGVVEPKVIKISPKKLVWLKKHKIGVRCGDQWKKLILEG